LCLWGGGRETAIHVREECVRVDRLKGREKMNGREWKEVRLRVEGKTNLVDRRILLVNEFAEEAIAEEVMEG